MEQFASKEIIRKSAGKYIFSKALKSERQPLAFGTAYRLLLEFSVVGTTTTEEHLAEVWRPKDGRVIIPYFCHVFIKTLTAIGVSAS
jgi:hypothetical protein